MALMIVVVPIVTNGIGAVFFTGTVEHRKMLHNEFSRGDNQSLSSEVASSERYRAKVYDMLAVFETELETMEPEKKEGIHGEICSGQNSPSSPAWTSSGRFCTDADKVQVWSDPMGEGRGETA